MSLEEKLRAFAKTPKGKKMVASSPVVISEAKKDAETMRDILAAKTASVIKSVGADAINISAPEPREEGLTVELNFAPEAVIRHSLVPEKFEDIENIVLLFSRGWSARGVVWGEWHGRTVASRRFYPPNPFMKEAVEAFNSGVRHGRAVLNDKY